MKYLKHILLFSCCFFAISLSITKAMATCQCVVYADYTDPNDGWTITFPVHGPTDCSANSQASLDIFVAHWNTVNPGMVNGVPTNYYYYSCFTPPPPTPVDGSCGSSNGGTFGNSTPPGSNLCNDGDASAVTTNPTTYTWSCNGYDGGGNSSCSATRSAALPPVNGACGSANNLRLSSNPPPSNMCSAGTASAMSGRNWTCSGSNGGTTASCQTLPCNTAINTTFDTVCDAYPTSVGMTPLQWATMICDTSVPGQILTLVNVNTSSSYCASAGFGFTTHREWKCDRPTLQCDTPPSSSPVNGSCGSANRPSWSLNGAPGVTSAPTTNLCATGTATTPTLINGTGLNGSVIVNSDYRWSCDGLNGGTSVNCEAAALQNGQCGTNNGNAGDKCAVSELWHAFDLIFYHSFPAPYTCAGLYGGTTASCGGGVNGTCGSSNGGTFGNSTPPTTNFCTAGTATAVTTNPSTYTWSCNGSGGGSNSSCTATRSSASINGTCGTANGQTLPRATLPSTNLCGAGTPTTVTATATNFTWSCNSTNGGANSPTCTATRAPPPPCLLGPVVRLNDFDGLKGQATSHATCLTATYTTGAGNMVNGCPTIASVPVGSVSPTRSCLDRIDINDTASRCVAYGRVCQ